MTTLRLSIRNMTGPQLADFRQAVNELQEITDNRGYQALAGIHGVPEFKCWHHQRQRNNPATQRMFLPWHRAYMLAMEQALQDRVAGVGLPWWNWASDISRTEGIPKAYSDETFSDDKPNPLYSFHIFEPSAGLDEDTWRSPQSPNRLPYPGVPDVVNRLLEIADWGDFSDAIQSVHDFIHGWVGGSMGAVATSAFDPIFFAHHCMIDRVWYLWQLRHGNSGIPQNLLNVVLSPFPQTVADVLNVQDLGYDYAAAESTSPGVN